MSLIQTNHFSTILLPIVIRTPFDQKELPISGTKGHAKGANKKQFGAKFLLQFSLVVTLEQGSSGKFLVNKFVTTRIILDRKDKHTVLIHISC